MVEGGRIDHGHHVGNAYRALGETIELSRRRARRARARGPADTLIVVTADHSHTLTIRGYPKRGNPILGLVRGSTGEATAEHEAARRTCTGQPYTTLGYANGPGYPGAVDEQPEGAEALPARAHAATPASTQGRPELADVDARKPDYLQEATVPLRAETHGGEDVPIYAGGPGAALFHGVQEQSYVYHAIVEALGWAK